MEFKEFAALVKNGLHTLAAKADRLYVVKVDREDMYEFYQNAYPAEVNGIFRKRRHYDGSHDRSFILNMGVIVGFIDGELRSIWDPEFNIVENNTPHYFINVAKAMDEYVRSKSIENVFVARHNKLTFGLFENKEKTENGEIIWNHFNADVRELPNDKIPMTTLDKSYDEIRGEHNTLSQVGYRSFTELSLDAAITVKELIDDQNLAKYEEYDEQVTRYIELKTSWDNSSAALMSDEDASGDDLKRFEQNFIWGNIGMYKALNIKNDVIGTLLKDLTDERDLEEAIAAFEEKTNGVNYKRPKKVRTKKMVEQAMKVIKEKNLESSLPRVHMSFTDVNVNDVIFTSSTVKDYLAGGLEDMLLSKTTDTTIADDKHIEVNMVDFIENIVPGSERVEVYLENKHENALVSLTKPKLPEAQNIFKWNNNVSWSYKGNITDSITEKVRKAGGNVDGDVRASLSWLGKDDLDIHGVILSSIGIKVGHIHFNNKYDSRTEGRLDVDMNANDMNLSEDSVENIYWQNIGDIPEGMEVVIVVHNFKQRTGNNGFELEFKTPMGIKTFTYDKPVSNEEEIHALKFKVTNGVVELVDVYQDLKEGSKEQIMWGLTTNKYHDVNYMMTSPNFWGENKEGNRHYIFVLEKCLNPDPVRGIFNEYLSNEYNKIRKVFEDVGEFTKAPYSETQLSGVGFSYSKENTVKVRVTKDSKVRNYLINVKSK